VNFNYNDSDNFDRRGVDDSLRKTPVKTSEDGSGDFELRSGSVPRLYNDTLVVTQEDVAVAAGGTETITQRTHTFLNVSSNRSGSANNDGGEGAAKVSFTYSGHTEA
jgi:hypothetical protein